HNATSIAKALVEEYGEEVPELAIGRWALHERDKDHAESTRTLLDSAIAKILDHERARCRAILTEKRALVIALRDLLIERKVLDRSSFAHLVT
ncbi:MAG TPA: hypothetical protein VFQ65_01125, partial [Kofleriaceae bacterium]|nr:hypothetical protein [Kofleriaceae bacterium]